MDTETTFESLAKEWLNDSWENYWFAGPEDKDGTLSIFDFDRWVEAERDNIRNSIENGEKFADLVAVKKSRFMLLPVLVRLAEEVNQEIKDECRSEEQARIWGW